MPRRYARKPYSKPFRRYGKKYGRARWKNKKFSKFNNKSRASIKGLIMPKSAYVKLPWRRIATTTTINPSNSYATLWVPTGYIPAPSDYTSVPTRIQAQAGDTFTNGIDKYSQFFDVGYVLGSSLKLQVMNCNTVFAGGNQTPQILATLVCYPYNHQGNTTVGLDPAQNVRAVYNYLESLTDDNLQSLAYAQSRLITLGYSKSEIFMKMFRKTKQMTGIKDVEDNDDMEINLPQTGIDFSSTNYCSGQGYLYYLRLTNIAGDGANAQVVRVNAKLTQYWKLTSRRAVLQGVAQNAP